MLFEGMGNLEVQELTNLLGEPQGRRTSRFDGPSAAGYAAVGKQLSPNS